MTEAQLRRVVHSAFYRVVRTHNPLSSADFYNAKIEDTWPTTPSPTDWSDFWYESVSVEIQGAIMARDEFLDSFSFKWLKDNQGSKWEDIIDLAKSNLVPLRS